MRLDSGRHHQGTPGQDRPSMTMSKGPLTGVGEPGASVTRGESFQDSRFRPRSLKSVQLSLGAFATADSRCSDSRSKTMRYVTGSIAVLLLGAILIFSIQNRTAVDVSFLLWSVSIPKVFLILGTYVLGMVSGWGLLELVKRSF